MKLNKYSSSTRLAVSGGVFLFAFLTALFASSSFTPVQDSSAEDVAAVLNASGYFLNLTSDNNGVVAIDLATTASGKVGIAKDTINIKSNAPDGYDLYLSMNGRNADDNRLYKDGVATNAAPFIRPTSGTWDTPSALDINSWGYALSSTTVGLPISGGNFNDSYNTNVPDEAALFAGVPLAGNEQLIQTVSAPDATNGINTDIYYGVKANTALPSGSYKGTITYTAIAKSNIAASDQTSVSPSVTTKLEGGELLTIATMLSVAASEAEEAGKEVSVTVGGQTCANVVLDNAQDGSLMISCTAPSMATGRYDVGVDVPKYDKFWLIVNGLEYKYSTQDLQQATGGSATAADIVLGKTAYVGGNQIVGTMPSYDVQYDNSKTAEENTADAGLTWSTDSSTLTVSEGRHISQQVALFTYTPIISGISQLTSGRTRGYPSDTTKINLTNRTLPNNSYIVGLSYNNFYDPAAINNFQVTNNAINLNVNSPGYGIAFTMPISTLGLTAGRLMKLSYSASDGVSCYVTFYGWTSGAPQQSSQTNEYLTFMSCGGGRILSVPGMTTQMAIVFAAHELGKTLSVTDVLLERVDLTEPLVNQFQ